MGRFAQVHPEELTRAVGEAVADGTTAAEVQRQLAAGTFSGHDGPYEMSYSTVLHYGQRETRRRDAQGINPSVQTNALRAIDGAARGVITLALDELARSREAKRPDLEHVGKIVDLLKKAQALVQPESPSQPTNGGKAKGSDKPSRDPLTSALTAAAKQPVPDIPRRKGARGDVGPANTPKPTHADIPPAAGLPQVPVPDHSPFVA